MRKNRKRCVILCSNRIAIYLVLACCLAYGDSRFLQETTASFWETNLVATVVGYSSQRTFLGVNIPEMDPTGQSAREVWLYSVAPTNYAGITFSLHSCGLDLLRVYPTNQLFVFPSSPCAYSTCSTNRSEYWPVAFDQAFRNYCPYRTFEKWFPITDGQLQDWIVNLTERINSCQERVTILRGKLGQTSDNKKRSFLLQEVEYNEKMIKSNQSAIDGCKIQAKYFQDRIKWLQTQGLCPTQ